MMAKNSVEETKAVVIEKALDNLSHAVDRVYDLMARVHGDPMGAAVDKALFPPREGSLTVEAIMTGELAKRLMTLSGRISDAVHSLTATLI